MIDKDTIIKLAEEAGLDIDAAPGVPAAVERFAAAVYQQGLEDAAKVCDTKSEDPNEWAYEKAMASRCAVSIRALKDAR